MLGQQIVSLLLCSSHRVQSGSPRSGGSSSCSITVVVTFLFRFRLLWAQEHEQREAYSWLSDHSALLHREDSLPLLASTAEHLQSLTHTSRVAQLQSATQHHFPIENAR